MGGRRYFVEGHEPALMHEAMAATLDTACGADQAASSRTPALHTATIARPRWPMIVLNSPKGWTGPKMVDGLQIEGTFRSHQVPLSDPATHPEHLKLLEDWLRSYRPEELFDEQGRLKPELAELAPTGRATHGRESPRQRRHAAPRPADAGFPRLRGRRALAGRARHRRHARARTFPARRGEAQQRAAEFPGLRPGRNALQRPGSASSKSTTRQWDAATAPNDEFLAPTGRVLEMLSEHQCEGWLEGYLLTGRHGLFNCYEAFIHIVDSMFNQHAKWLKVTAHLPWRRKIASLNYLLASHVWRQDHNGFTHQDPGFIDLVMNKKAEVVRVYLPPTPTASSR